MYPLKMFAYLETRGPVRKEDRAAYCYMNARFAMDVAAGCETTEGREENLAAAVRWQLDGARYSALERGEAR